MRAAWYGVVRHGPDATPTNDGLALPPHGYRRMHELSQSSPDLTGGVHIFNTGFYAQVANLFSCHASPNPERGSPFSPALQRMNQWVAPHLVNDRLFIPVNIER